MYIIILLVVLLDLEGAAPPRELAHLSRKPEGALELRGSGSCCAAWKEITCGAYACNII